MTSTGHRPDPIRDELLPAPEPVTGWPRDAEGDERRPVDMTDTHAANATGSDVGAGA